MKRTGRFASELAQAPRIGEKLFMPGTATVRIHPSQFPDAVRRDLLESLRRRSVNHKFHYDSVKQTQKWLALHQIYSPSRNDENCAATYDLAFESTTAHITSKSVHVIGLGCGGGQKDTRLLQLLKQNGAQTFYTPCDVSAAMTLAARETALAAVAEEHCLPFVCDLANADDLPEILPTRHPSLITFFGMIPNFEPADILPRLAALLRDDDFLLFSANLAPGPDYAEGVRRILPQYDNAPTREWLMTFLLDLGVERGDGELRLSIEEKQGLKRVVAGFVFKRARNIEIENDAFAFRSGGRIRLFFSYRYTPELVRQTLHSHHLNVLDAWITRSGEEGVFLVKRG